MSETKLNSTPDDGISAVKFAPNSSQFLLVSSWDCTVRLYDINENFMRMKYVHSTPVLDCCFQDAVHVFSGGLDKVLKLYNFNTGTETVIGGHDNAVRCIEFCSELNLVISGGWDAVVKLWDPRSNAAVGSLAQPDRVYTMSLCGDKLIVGTAGRRVLVWDLRNTGFVQQRRESSLKYQTRCIRAFPDKQGYVLSSIEGRVAVEYLDPKPEVQKKKYVFKCHRVKEDGIEKIYPVNAIAFHNVYSTFATGGSDGFVYIWDGFNKKRLCQFRKYPASISSLSFSTDGSVLQLRRHISSKKETWLTCQKTQSLFGKSLIKK